MSDNISLILASFLVGVIIMSFLLDQKPVKGPTVEHHYFQVPVPYCPEKPADKSA